MKSYVYDVNKSYENNFANPPKFEHFILSKEAAKAPVGVAAGPLLNSGYIKAAIDLGAGVVVYKTVRSQERKCLPFPNCVDIDDKGIIAPGKAILSPGTNTQTAKRRTNSFGMPSTAPEIWQGDVKAAQDYADKHGRRMIVSCVGTPDDKAADPQRALAIDYARTAAMAVEAGAKEVELNFSCPNVRADLGAIYLSADFVRMIVKETRVGINAEIPLHIKVGNFTDKDGNANVKLMEEVVKAAAAAGATSINGINTVSMSVYKAGTQTSDNPDGEMALPGRPNAVSGVCGAGIADYAEEWLEDMVGINKKNKLGLEIGSSGGCTTGADLQKRLDMGANVAYTASGLMSNPEIFKEYHKQAR